MSLPLSPRSENSDFDLSLIDEISRSILSNLDRVGLLNSVVTLLHQIFRFTSVRIYTTRGQNYSSLKKVGISVDGIETETLYYHDQDRGPVGWCVSHLEPLVINEIGVDNRFPRSEFSKEARSELVTPLLQGDDFIGVLELCADIYNAFDPEAVQAFKFLADSIAIAVRNASFYRAEQLKSIIAERIQILAGSLSADETSESLCTRLLDELETIIPYDASAIWLLETSSDKNSIGQLIDHMQLAGFRFKDPSKAEQVEHYLQSTPDNLELFSIFPWANDVFRRKTASIRSEDADYEPLGGVLKFNHSYSALVTPLMVHEHAIGVLICAHHEPDQYDEEHLSIAQTFSNYCSIAIENARLYRVAHDQAWISTVLLQVSESTQSITNLDDLLETITRILPGLIGANACAIFLRDPSVETFFGSASHGFGDEQMARLKSWNILPGSVVAFEELKESRNPVILNNKNLPVELSSLVFPEYDLEKDLLILFPLLTQNFLNGTILVDFTNTELTVSSSQEVWDEKYILIQGAARQAAIAIENLQLIKAQEEEAYISVALLQVAQAVVSLNQLDEILATIVRITPILVGVKRCIIYIWDSKDQVFRQSQNYGFTKNDLASLGTVFMADEFPLFEAIHQSGRIVSYVIDSESPPSSWCEISAGDYDVYDGTSSDLDEISTRVADRSYNPSDRLLIGFPLSVKTENLGVMLIEEEDPLRGLTSIHVREKRIEIVKGITQQAAIAIKNEQLQQEAVKSERMERELQLAREIQATFLPDKLPEIPGWDIAVRWYPAREVGGDFYDFIMLDSNHMGFVIADVADKGMPAALFMTLIRTLIRAAAKEKPSPAAVLQQVNELLIPEAKQGIFVTVFYGVVSIDSGSIVYANAGHNPPIVKKALTDELIELTRTTIALGIFGDIEVEEKEIILNSGDWLLLYTDGITEAFSPQETMFGTERLMNLIRENEYYSVKDLAEQVINSVSGFMAGADLSDDITLAIIHREIK